MIVVTGGAGFIGSNLIKHLNQRGEKNILLIDCLKNGRQVSNIADLDIVDYLDKKIFEISKFNHVRAVFHQGACSDTTEWDGEFLMENNYAYSKRLLLSCLSKNIPFIYASSAAVYGTHGRPLNMYAYSKFLFDEWVKTLLPRTQTQIIGLRYFNVYGPREQHKGPMRSVVSQFNDQIIQNGVVRLFGAHAGVASGEQKRDFVYVDDVANINLWFLEHPNLGGIFDVGTGQAETFNAVAKEIINLHGRGSIEYINFPEQLKNVYQSNTQANISLLREFGYEKPFLTLEQGIRRYCNRLDVSLKS
ncbi:MAG: ADP-glyceromanno-heptose 6-epimerase [Myxococcaceae bacterium]